MNVPSKNSSLKNLSGAISKFTCVVMSLTSLAVFANNVDESSDTSIQDDVKVFEAIDFIRPKPIKRVDPIYPRNAAIKGQEGWVLLNFCVNLEGEVDDVVVVDSSGLNGLEKSARQAVRKWQYEPAIQNGENVYSCENLVQLDFYMGSDAGGVSRKFRTRYYSIYEKLEQEAVDAAREELDALLENNAWNMTEVKLTHQLQASYFGHREDRLRQNYHAARSLQFIRRAFELSLHDANTAATAIITSVQMGNLVDANNTFKKYFEGKYVLEDSPEMETLKAQLEQINSQIEEALEEDQVLTKKALLSNRGVLHHNLKHSFFSITNVAGNLDELEIRCDTKLTKLSVFPEQLVTIPETWGSCGLTVYGDGSTTLQIMEFKQAPTA